MNMRLVLGGELKTGKMGCNLVAGSHLDRRDELADVVADEAETRIPRVLLHDCRKGRNRNETELQLERPARHA